jgi:hypothetical protein
MQKYLLRIGELLESFLTRQSNVKCWIKKDESVSIYPANTPRRADPPEAIFCEYLRRPKDIWTNSQQLNLRYYFINYAKIVFGYHLAVAPQTKFAISIAIGLKKFEWNYRAISQDDGHLEAIIWLDYFEPRQYLMLNLECRTGRCSDRPHFAEEKPVSGR